MPQMTISQLGRPKNIKTVDISYRSSFIVIYKSYPGEGLIISHRLQHSPIFLDQIQYNKTNVMLYLSLWIWKLSKYSTRKEID